MKGMNFEEWQALMRTQRNGGTSSEIHNHEAVISNKNPNSEHGNAAADELRAKQRYHNEQSKGMATDRKEEVAPLPIEYVSFSTVLNTDMLIALYKGRVIIPNVQQQVTLGGREEQINAFIQSKETFHEFTAHVPYSLSLIRFRYEDQQPIVVGDDTITIAEVPGNALFNIIPEPKFILTND